MIYGIGIDIIEIERIQQSVEKFGDKFLKRVFTPVELEYSNGKANRFQHLAARFAAKEAVAKAMSQGWSGSFNWQDIEVYNEPSGMPSVKLFNQLKDYLGTDKELKLTMSHSHHYVTCFAILHSKES